MSPIKTLAKGLYIMARILAFLYLVTTLYAFFSLVTRWNIRPYGEAMNLHIDYPFTDQAFLNVDNNWPYLCFSFLMPMLYYGIFFWWAANVFSVFFQPKLFKEGNVRLLIIFYRLNLFLPIPLIVLGSFFVPVEYEIIVLAIVHTVLGVFVYFLAIILQQGLKLQIEQDLII